MLNGLYKIEIETGRASDRGVAVARDGRIFGGNSAFAFAGSYRESGGEILAEISMLRHDDDEGFTRVFGTDEFSVTLIGSRQGEHYVLKADAPSPAGIAFKAAMTAISEEAAPPVAASGSNGIRNGLYSINIRMLDGIDGGNTGIMVLRDGEIRGGDAFFDYLGAYTSAAGRWKGEIVNHEHTPSRGERPVFGGREVGIGFSGTYTDEGAEGEATALAGKRSVRFRAVLRKLVAIED